MIRKLLIFTLMLNLALHASAYVERNLLQQQADIDKLKEVPVLNREWASYSTYTDREQNEKGYYTFKFLY